MIYRTIVVPTDGSDIARVAERIAALLAKAANAAAGQMGQLRLPKARVVSRVVISLAPPRSRSRPLGPAQRAPRLH